MRKNVIVFLLLNLACATQVARAADRVIVDNYDERPVPVKAYPPAYPPEMLKARVSGLVNLAIVIDDAGVVVERAVVRSTRAEFEQPALDAVRKWKFKPAVKGGAAVTVRMIVPIQFSPEN